MNDKKIDGVFHCAGVPIEQSPLLERSHNEFAKMFKAKVYGSLILNELLEGMNTKFIILFSSLNSVIAQRNSADYAAANAFLDGLTESGEMNVDKIISINWPGWSETGMSVRGQTKAINTSELPIKPLKTIDGLKGLKYAMSFEKNSSIIISDINLSHYKINPIFQINGMSDLNKASVAESENIEK